MRKLLAIALALMLFPLHSLADDLADMPSEDLVQLRLAIDQELAARQGSDAAQAVAVDGVVFRLLRVEIGQARDDLAGLGVVLLASNPGDASMSPFLDLGVTVSQGGRPLETSWVVSDTFTSTTVSTGHSVVVRPGAVDIQIFLGYCLNGEGDNVEITLSRKHTRIGEDPYCGTFVVDLGPLR